ncbi:glycosyltransferase [Amedibacterium intestinale]|uniref:glycosyltransferase n=1 Tax=Amedibacterium intestinale TaxID=2583452 RepID=UPI000E52DB26|nr:glycosyltransferase [Amedibacterium intestinale]RHO21531.1 glycosyltransferase [Eubacterium sp. AM18-26]RHO25695.1 glycosyltransferase [Eubacterium sp. AM18-10LB-B]RHO28958.1 glycosyltransferase [Erysipelotrichaceae bacterium AM17-60]
MKVLIASPIRQKPQILQMFLKSLEQLNLDNIELEYYFVDDNEDIESIKVLNEFNNTHENVLIKNSSEFLISKEKEDYKRESTHIWKKSLIERIILFKNDMIDYAKNNKFDYIFFIDSDLILNRNTLNHLISLDKEIVSNVFWTKWKLNFPYLPQVWLQDETNRFEKNWDIPNDQWKYEQDDINFVSQLMVPGTYKVGGLGACTLIKLSALLKGVSFSLIDNISFWGEDRHFCVRARALGCELYVDTNYPALHLYREYYVNDVEKFYKFGFSFNRLTELDKKFGEKKFQKNNLDKKRSIKKSLKHLYIKYLRKKIEPKRTINENSKITLSMVVKNEEKRYLKEMLEETKDYVDEYVIIDDCSTDNTVNLCKSVLSDKKLHMIINKHSMFSKEYKLRKLQWKETVKTDPDWILFLDADEIFEKKFKEDVKYLINNPNVDAYCFRLYDMWNENEYREDEFWNAHSIYRPFLIRYQKEFKYRFLKKNQHCGRMPKNVLWLKYADSDIRLKHLGWMNPQDRKRKYQRYLALDKEGKMGNMEQYKSILDDNPNLLMFEEKNES